MPKPRVVALSVLVLGSLGGGPASGEPHPDSEPSWLAAALVGPATGAPEQDRPDFDARDRGCHLVPRFSENVGFHGPITGEAEKDNVGFLLSGHDGCPGAPIR